jgi:hypothetical protein
MGMLVLVILLNVDLMVLAVVTMLNVVLTE